MNLGVRGAQGQTNALVDLCNYASHVLQQSAPRRLYALAEKRPILIFTDGSWESGKSGIGAVIIDTASSTKLILTGEVPETLLSSWRHQVGEQLICQIELFAMVTVRWSFRDLLKDRRTLWWVDNEAARFSTIKGHSPSVTMSTLVREFYRWDISHPTFGWIERIPSFSNPADGPSRFAPEEVQTLLGVDTVLPFQHSPELLAKLRKTKLVP